MLGLTQKLVRFMFITILFGLNQRLQTWVTRETLVQLDRRAQWEFRDLQVQRELAELRDHRGNKDRQVHLDLQAQQGRKGRKV